MNDVQLSGGGNGGGIAIIMTRYLKSNAYKIKSDGETPVHIIGTADDDMVLGTQAMAGRLGERARFVEIPGDHFVLLAAGDNIRQIVLDNLDFLLLRESEQKGAMSGWRR